MLNKIIPELRKLSIPWKTPWKKIDKINLNDYLSRYMYLNTDHFDSQQKEKIVLQTKKFIYKKRIMNWYHLIIWSYLTYIDQSQIQINYPPCGWYSSMNSTKMNRFSSDTSICIHVTITLRNYKNKSTLLVIFFKFALGSGLAVRE